MKNRFLWMLAAILTLCGTMLTLTSCGDDDETTQPDQTYDKALKPGEIFEETVKFDCRQVESGEWLKAELLAKFKVLEGDFKGSPQVSLNQIYLVGGVYRLSFLFDLYRDDQWYVITTLGDDCLGGKSNLQFVALDYFTQHVGKGVFRGAPILEEVTFGLFMESVGEEAFAECPKLPSINWRVGRPVSLGNLAFAKCAALKQVSITCTEFTMGSSVFKDCPSLQNVNLNGGKLNIDKTVFEGCPNLESLNFGSWQETLESDMFQGMDKLKDIRFGNGLKVVKSGAFENCTSLKEVHLPGTLEQVEPNVFLGCTSLQRIVIHGGHAHFSSIGLPEGVNVVVEE